MTETCMQVCSLTQSCQVKGRWSRPTLDHWPGNRSWPFPFPWRPEAAGGSHHTRWAGCHQMAQEISSQTWNNQICLILPDIKNDTHTHTITWCHIAHVVYGAFSQDCTFPEISPGYSLQLVKELSLHHGDLVNDQVPAARPVLQHPRPLGQLNALLQRGGARADTWKEDTWTQREQRNKGKHEWTAHV